MYGISEAAQTIDIAPEGSRGYVQSARELCSRPVALCLEKRKQPKEPSRRLQHENDCAMNRGPKLSSIVDSVSGIDSANTDKADQLLRTEMTMKLTDFFLAELEREAASSRLALQRVPEDH